MIKKGKIFSLAEKIRDGKVLYTESKAHDSAVNALIKTTDLNLLSSFTYFCEAC